MEIMETNAKEQTTNDDARLGKCEVCNFNLAKYTCPKCEVKTCRLECLQIHKKELECDGIRDKTKYIPMKQITESDLMSDYVFLEDCTHYASARRTDKIKRYTAHGRSLAIPQTKLKKAAAAPERQTTLQFLLPNFERHKTNTTYFDWKSKVIFWRIEWRFANANNGIAIDERCSELDTMTTLIEKYFENKTSNESIASYREQGIENVVLLLKAEGIRKSQNRFYSIDASKTLRENLCKRTIVEFPIIYVVFKEDVKNFDVISNDEDFIEEETKIHKSIYFPAEKGHQTRPRKSTQAGPSEQNPSAEQSVNFLFSNENDADDTEEE